MELSPYLMEKLSRFGCSLFPEGTGEKTGGRVPFGVTVLLSEGAALITFLDTSFAAAIRLEAQPPSTCSSSQVRSVRLLSNSVAAVCKAERNPTRKGTAVHYLKVHRAPKYW